MSRTDLAFHHALCSPAAPALRAREDLYASLIGTWDAEVVDHLPEGRARRQSAEIHFARVLAGRAVQDVWIAPARSERSPVPGAPGAGQRYGTTLRVHDPRSGAWRIAWFDPATGVETRLVGRREGERIVHVGTDDAGRLLRWTLAPRGDDEFHWRGEASRDGGASWTTETEYFARRRVEPAPADGSRDLRISWSWTDRPGLETLRVARHASGTSAEGHLVTVLDGAPIRVRYRIEHDAAWRFHGAHIEVEGAGGTQATHLVRAEGGWTVQGAPRPDLAGCEDLDLMVTPYTNTPPLSARPLTPGASRRLGVAWVRFPGLEVRAVEQEYTRLECADTLPVAARYLYRNLENGFSGELATDADGLVLEYGPWRRS